jgi:hypothetical protein
MKVVLDLSGHISRVEKEIAPGTASRRSVGVFAARSDGAAGMLARTLNLMLRKYRHAIDLTYSWHNVVNEIAAIEAVRPVYVPGSDWREVDLHVDLNLLLNLSLGRQS